MFFQECSVGQHLHLLKSIEHIKASLPTYLAVPQCSESIASSHREGYHYTLLMSYGPPWAHYIGGYQDRLLGGPLGLPDLCRKVPDGVRRKDYSGKVLG
jgi:hypothetical protein